MRVALEISGLSMGGLGRSLRGLFSRSAPSAPSAYEGGRANRRDADFNPMEIGPNALADQTLALVRRRTRWLGDNHPLVAGMKATYINNVLGPTGVTLRPATRWPELNKRLAERWWAREEAADPGREQSSRDIQAIYLGEVFDAGDCLVHHAVTEPFRGAPSGPAVELLPAEQVDFSDNRDTRGVSVGNRVRQGVEFDPKGRRVAYHVLREHPSDGWFGAGRFGETVRVPADRARLGFLARRPGMVRGVPMVVSVIQTVRLEGRYQEAFLDLAVAAACLGIFFRGLPPNSKLMQQLQLHGAIDAAGRPITRIEPGMIGFVSPGVELEIHSPNIPGPQFQATVDGLARLIGAGVGMGYADTTRDESKTTFSASRAESLKGRKLYRPAQIFVYHTQVQPFYASCVAHDITSGAVPLTAEQQNEWLTNPVALTVTAPILPGWEWVNPQQDAQAAEIEIGLGTRSVPEICAERGRHWMDVLDEQLEAEVYEREQRQKLGLEPRKPAPVRAPAPDEDPPDKPDKKGDDKDARVRAGLASRVDLLGLNGRGNGVAHA